jgi:ankyrin repeat protein
MLLEHGADASIVDASGWGVLHWATAANRRDVLELARGLRTGPVDIVDHSGGTPAAWAAQMGDCIALDWLLEHGADPNHVDRDGWAPLHHAGAIGSTAAIRALVEAGAKAMQRLPPSRGEEYGHLASDLLRHHHPECIDGLRILEDAETAEDSGATGAFD